MWIAKNPDKIVMVNPGTILTGRKQMMKSDISQLRNKGLFKMFNLIGLGEHAGHLSCMERSHADGARGRGKVW